MPRKRRTRKEFTPGQRFGILKRHKRVLIECPDCIAELVRLGRYGGEFVSGAWHWLDAMQFDHIHEQADGGKSRINNGRPRCSPCHQKKSAKSEAMRHHLDRAARNHAGEAKPTRRPLAKGGKFPRRGRASPAWPSRKMESRPFPKRPEDRP